MKEKKFRIVTRVTEKEYERIKSKAKKAKLSMSEFIRQAAIKAPNRSAISDNYGKHREHMDKLIDHLELAGAGDEARAILQHFGLSEGR